MFEQLIICLLIPCPISMNPQKFVIAWKPTPIKRIAKTNRRLISYECWFAVYLEYERLIHIYTHNQLKTQSFFCTLGKFYVTFALFTYQNIKISCKLINNKKLTMQYCKRGSTFTSKSVAFAAIFLADALVSSVTSAVCLLPWNFLFFARFGLVLLSLFLSMFYSKHSKIAPYTYRQN